MQASKPEWASKAKAIAVDSPEQAKQQPLHALGLLFCL
jgi:hypothetical protein